MSELKKKAIQDLPSCELGFTLDDLKKIIGEDLTEFHKWMAGQTVSFCDGRAYDYELEAYINTGCGPHGSVYYYHDVKRFLQNRPVS